MKANSMSIFKATIISLCSALVLLGCGESPSKHAQNATSNNEQSKAVVASSQDQQKDIDYDFPVTSYVPIRNLPDSKNWHWHSIKAVSSENSFTDYELVGAYGGEAFRLEYDKAEGDSFKEASVVKKYLPQSKSMFAKYAQAKYLAAPFGVNDDSEIPLTVEIGKYSIERKGFPVRWYVASTDIGNQMKPQSSDENEEGMYWVTVEDENIARTIESLRARNNLKVIGAVLFHVDRRMDNDVSVFNKFAITHILYRIINVDDTKTLISVHHILNKDGAVKTVNEEF